MHFRDLRRIVRFSLDRLAMLALRKGRGFPTTRKADAPDGAPALNRPALFSSCT